VEVGVGVGVGVGKPGIGLQLFGIVTNPPSTLIVTLQSHPPVNKGWLQGVTESIDCPGSSLILLVSHTVKVPQPPGLGVFDGCGVGVGVGQFGSDTSKQEARVKAKDSGINVH